MRSPICRCTVPDQRRPTCFRCRTAAVLLGGPTPVRPLHGPTKGRLPARLVYFEELQTLAQARQRERALKNGRTRRKTIDHLIAAFPPERLAPFA